jgi:hypothetical protein
MTSSIVTTEYVKLTISDGTQMQAYARWVGGALYGLSRRDASYAGDKRGDFEHGRSRDV